MSSAGDYLSDIEPHASKQQRFFNEANSLAIPAARSRDVVEIVGTSGYCLFFPIPASTKDWKNNEISWLCETLRLKEDISDPNDALNFCKYLGTYSLEIATLLCSISELSGTPSSLNNRTNVVNDIISKENFPTVAELYKLEYGSEASVPKDYQFNHGQNGGGDQSGIVINADGYAETNTNGISAANSSKLKPNWIPGMAGRGKVEVPVTYSWEFDLCTAEAIANVETKLAQYQDQSATDQGGRGGTGGEGDGEGEEEGEEGEDGEQPQRNQDRSKGAKNIKRFGRILFPWYLKSRIDENDRFIYPNIDREAFGRYTNAAAVYDEDELYEDYLRFQQRTNRNSSSSSSTNGGAGASSRVYTAPTNVTGGRSGGGEGRNISSFGLLGFPLAPKVKLPKVIPYVIYVPASNDTYHLLIVLKFVDPHFDPIALSKRIQQPLLDKSSGPKKDREFHVRDVSMTHIPHLNEGFHNENRVFKRSGNPSLADNPQAYFRFLCDYYATTVQEGRFQSPKKMAQHRHEAQTMASDANFDPYCSTTHPLNLNTLFSWERASNFFKAISDSEKELEVIKQLDQMITQVPIRDVEDPLALSPARLNIKYKIDLKPLITNNNDSEIRYRAYRYPANQFRWLYPDRNRGAKYQAGLSVEMMPHVFPVFQLDDDTYAEIVRSKQPSIRSQSNQGGIVSLVARSVENQHLLREVLSEYRGTPNTNDYMDVDTGSSSANSRLLPPVPTVQGKTKMGGIYNLFKRMTQDDDEDENPGDGTLHRNATTEPAVCKAPTWTHLLDEDNICLQTEIKVIPNSKLPAGYDSYLIYLVLIEKRITGPLFRLKPSLALRMRTINYLVNTLSFGRRHNSSDQREELYFRKRIQSFAKAYNHFFAHYEKHRCRMINFTNNYFFNPKIVERVGKVLNEGWINVVHHFGELLKHSQGSIDQIVNNDLDRLKPSYYRTMLDGYTMRGPIDSVLGAWFEQQARRLYEQVGLYQNNSLFFVGMFGCVFCIFRMDGKDKFNLLFIGAFAAGKSHLLTLIAPMCIKNFIYALQAASEQAFVGTGFQGDRLLNCPEGFSLLETNPDLMKGLITDSSANKTVCSHDPKTGIRIKNDYFGGFYFGFMIAQNDPPEDLALKSRFFCPIATRDNKILDKGDKTMNLLVRQRYRDKVFATTARDTYDKMFDLVVYLGCLSLGNDDPHQQAIPPPNTDQAPNSASSTASVVVRLPKRPMLRINPTTTDHEHVIITDAEEDDGPLISIPDNPLNRNVERNADSLIHKTNTGDPLKLQGRIEMEEYWQHTQLILFWLHKLQAQGAICQTSMDFWENVESSFKEKIETHFPYLFAGNPRILSRIRTVILGVCEMDAIRRVFYCHLSPYFNKPVQPEYVRALSPYLAVTLEHICIGVSIANDEILDNVRGKIIMAFLKVSGFYEYCYKFNQHINPIAAPVEPPNSTKESHNEPPPASATGPNANMAQESAAIKAILALGYEHGIKIDRPFCEATGFHKVGWLHTKKSEVLDVALTHFSTAPIPTVPPPHPLQQPPPPPPQQPSPPEPMDTDEALTAPKKAQVQVGSRRQRPQVKDFGNGSETRNPPPIRTRNLIYDSREAIEIKPDECIDLNKICIRVENSGRPTNNNQYGMPKNYVDTLRRELVKGGCSDIADKVFESEIAKMINTPIKVKEKRFNPIPYADYLHCVNDPHDGILIPIIKGDKDEESLSIRSGSDGSLLSFEPQFTSGGTHTKNCLNIILDVQALRYLDGYQILMDILKSIAEELPVKRVRIPLLFHGPGAELSWITVGSHRFGSNASGGVRPKSTKNTVKFQSRKLDPYRCMMDYNVPINDSSMANELTETNGETEDDLYDNEDHEVELTNMIDLNDYYRLKHILYGNIMEMSLDEEKNRFFFHLVDYTKAIKDEGRIEKKNITYFFESTRRSALWDDKDLAHVRDVINQHQKKRGRDEDSLNVSRKVPRNTNQ